MNIYEQRIRESLKNLHADKRVKVASDEVVPAIDRGNRMVYGWATRRRLDMEGEVVNPDGVDLETYFPKMVKGVYLNHDTNELPIGVCRRCFKKDDGIWLESYISAGDIGDTVLTLIEDGAMGHYSIGAIVTDYSEPNGDEMLRYGANCTGIIRSSILRETSLVAMPALPDAKLQSMAVDRFLGRFDNLVTKGMIPRRMASKFGVVDISETRAFYPVSGFSLVDDSDGFTVVN